MKTKRNPAFIVSSGLWSNLKWTMLIFWIIFIAAVVLINIFIRPQGIDVELSESGVWANSSTSPKIFMLVMGIVLTPVYLASYVSSGITRKHFHIGAIQVFALLSLLSACILTIGFPVERALVDWIGAASLPDHPPLFRTLIENFFLIFGYFGCGWIIGTAFYRFNWKLGVVICVLSLIPLWTMETIAHAAGAMKGIGLQGLDVDFIPSIGIGLEMLLFLLLSFAVFAVNRWMMRNITIKRKLT